MNDTHRLIASCLVALASSGCAGGGPLLHPAQPLKQGVARFAAGSSGNFAVGEAADAINNARKATSASIDRPTPNYVKGAAVAAAVGPGVAPFLSGRVGTGWGTEGGLSYTGRAVRIDGRYAYEVGSVALSVGVGGSRLLERSVSESTPVIDGLDLAGMTGWGVDVPVLFGWQSTSQVVWWWFGARGGYQAIMGNAGYTSQLPSAQLVSGDIDLKAAYVSALTGFAFGFRHLHAAVEMQAGYHNMSGKIWSASTNAKGMSLTPAAAIIATF